MCKPIDTRGTWPHSPAGVRKMETWTVDEMMRFKPCDRYSRERLCELAAGRPSLTALEILDLDVPAVDRIWALLTKGSHVSRAVDRIVTRAVKTHCLDCGVPSVEAWARKWLDGDRSAGAAWAPLAAAEAAAAVEWAAAAVEWAAAEAESAAEAALAWAAEAAAEAALAAALSEAEAAEAEAAEAAEAAWAAAEAGAIEERNRQLNDIRQAIEESE